MSIAKVVKQVGQCHAGCARKSAANEQPLRGKHTCCSGQPLSQAGQGKAKGAQPQHVWQASGLHWAGRLRPLTFLEMKTGSVLGRTASLLTTSAKDSLDARVCSREGAALEAAEQGFVPV